MNNLPGIRSENLPHTVVCSNRVNTYAIHHPINTIRLFDADSPRRGLFRHSRRQRRRSYLNTFRHLLSDESAPASTTPNSKNSTPASASPRSSTHRKRHLPRNPPQSGAMLPAPAAVPSNTSAAAATPSAKPAPREKQNIEKRTRRSRSRQTDQPPAQPKVIRRI